ncbi:hypothetical protein FOL47_000119 [Perkinsus chesapeaki]|uniref:Uncharacterized protein n=1 Tax=Perkinsus chesapeaki TaxID=330153 RepID=A0A7J6N177_PERCH|nr:hypothetical protein FOL47_000119 [Perkinsus chesapeaki]
MSKEVNQARLGMLGELMENRKRAEESEQFFLTRMQQEATSFQQLVQMFEDSLGKVTADLDSRLAGFIRAEDAERLVTENNKSLEEKISSLEKKLDMKAHETSARIACVEASLSEVEKRLKEEKEEQLVTLNSKITDISTSYKAEIATSQSAVNSRISAMEEKMQSSLCNIEDEMKQGFSTVNSERLDAMEGGLSGLSSRLDAFDSKIDAVDNCIISIQAKHEKDRETESGQREQMEKARKTLEDNIKGKLEGIEQKISELEANVAMKTDSETVVQKCEEMVAGRLSTLSSELDSRFETIGKQMLDFQKTCDDQTEEFAAEQEHLKEELGKVHEVAKAASVDGSEKSAKLELKLQRDIKDITKQIEVVQPRIDDIQRDIQTKLGLISRKLRHLSHSGLNHTWKLTDALNKIGALGVSAGRFLDSPPFALGAYKNMQLRLFPKGCGHGPPGAASNLVMQKSAACSLWLVWNPQGSNRDSRLPPIRVELAVGKSRKGPLEMGHHESLYGCYVWQGNDICVLEHELLADGSLEVSVSIPYRQWYDALELTPDEADFEKGQLSSEIAQNVFHPKPEASDEREALGSSRMSIASSAFTFAPDMPGIMSNSVSAPVGVSPPMPRIPESSNPFDRTLPSLTELQPRALIRPSSAAQLRSFSPTPAFSDGEATVSNSGDRIRPQTMNLSTATRNPFSTSGSDIDVPTAPNSPSATARQTQPMHRQRNSVPASFSHPAGARGSETVSPRRSNWTQFAGTP